jgi:hypothetical protein
MIARVAVFLLLLGASVEGSAISSGTISTQYSGSFGNSDFTWIVQIESGAGGYSVQFHTNGSTFFNCACDVNSLQAGTAATLAGNVGFDFGGLGTATINGIFYPDVAFAHLTPSSTGIHLESFSFPLHPGFASPGFTMNGVLWAFDRSGGNLLLDEPITGSGYVTLFMSYTAGPGSPLSVAYQTNPGYITWTFLPEPANWVVIPAGLIMLLVRSAALRGSAGQARG